jgi:hypothetical protein
MEGDNMDQETIKILLEATGGNPVLLVILASAFFLARRDVVRRVDLALELAARHSAALNRVGSAVESYIKHAQRVWDDYAPATRAGEEEDQEEADQEPDPNEIADQAERRQPWHRAGVVSVLLIIMGGLAGCGSLGRSINLPDGCEMGVIVTCPPQLAPGVEPAPDTEQPSQAGEGEQQGDGEPPLSPD